MSVCIAHHIQYFIIIMPWCTLLCERCMFVHGYYNYNTTSSPVGKGDGKFMSL